MWIYVSILFCVAEICCDFFFNWWRRRVGSCILDKFGLKGRMTEESISMEVFV